MTPSASARLAEAANLAARRARGRRDRWARTFRPAAIDLLIVGEAPPASLDRYFYFPDVWTQDALFRHVVKAVLRIEPLREEKRELLARLRDAGVFLIDVSTEPLDDGPLAQHVPGLIRRARRLKPRKIILVKANVYDEAYESLVAADLPVIDARIRFPGQGWQAEFVDTFRRAMRRKPTTEQ